jgi:FAD/FMN-containing dehydrogenase
MSFMRRVFPSVPNAAWAETPEELEKYRRDESHVVGRPPVAAVRPRGPDALRELVRVAKGEGLTLVPRGAGTGKAGGAVPAGDCIVVDLSDYPGGIAVSKADLALRAPAGAPLREVKAAAAAAGLHYPPDPNSWDACSFGGSLATNAGGPCACKYGMTRHWALSVDALMEDGGVHRFGADTVKNNAGPSLAQLMVGSEGIFGIIVGASARLAPAPRERATLLLPAKDWAGLLRLPAGFVERGLLPSAFEFWDPAVLETLRRHGPPSARGLPGEALAVVEFDDAGCTGDAFLSGVMDALGGMAECARAATGEAQRAAVWDVRRQTSAVLKELHPDKVSEDVAVPRSRIGDFFEGAGRLGLPMVTYGHLGDGNLHVNFLLGDGGGDEGAEGAVDALFRLALGLGGTITGEHGIGLAKRKAFLELADPWQVGAIRAVKRALDPQGVFNAGKVI